MDISKIVFGKRFSLVMPGEEVDGAGQERITTLLVKALAAHLGLSVRETRYAFAERLPRDWTWRWHQPNGRYAGNLTKRFQSFCYKAFNFKLTPKQVEEIGNLAKINSTVENTFWFDFTRDLNWRRGEFGDEKSCFHIGDMHMQRLEALGVLAIRMYAGETGRGIGRMWLYPWSGDQANPQPADPNAPAGFLGFNAYGLHKQEYQEQLNDEGEKKTYGQLQTLDYSRVLSLYLGVSYTQVHIAAMGKTDNDGPMFFNNHGKSACLIAPVELVNEFKPTRNNDDELTPSRVNLAWSTELFTRLMPTCTFCGNRVGPAATRYIRKQADAPYYDKPLCEECARVHFSACVVCQTIHPSKNMTKWTWGGNVYAYCAKHRTAHSLKCYGCGRAAHRLTVEYILVRHPKSQRLHLAAYCQNCASYLADVLSCEKCGTQYRQDTHRGEQYEKLPENLTVHCPRCASRRKRQEQPAEEEEEVDPVVLQYQATAADLDPNPFRQMHAALRRDADMLLEFGRDDLLPTDAPLPLERPYRGYGYGYLRYHPDDTTRFCISVPRWDEFADALGVGRPLQDLLAIGEDGKAVWSVDNCLLLALYARLPLERASKGLYTGMLDKIAFWRYEMGDGQLQAAFKNTDDLVRTYSPLVDQPLQLVGFLLTLLESYELFTAVATLELLYNTGFAEVEWAPRGEVRLRLPAGEVKVVEDQARLAYHRNPAHIAEVPEPPVKMRIFGAQIPARREGFDRNVFVRDMDGNILYTDVNVGRLVDQMPGLPGREDGGDWYSPIHGGWPKYALRYSNPDVKLIQVVDVLRHRPLTANPTTGGDRSCLINEQEMRHMLVRYPTLFSFLLQTDNRNLTRWYWRRGEEPGIGYLTCHDDQAANEAIAEFKLGPGDYTCVRIR